MMSFMKGVLKPLLQKSSPQPDPAPDKIRLTLPAAPLAIKPIEEEVHAQSTRPSSAEAAAATGVVLPPSQNDAVAVLTLGEKGEILSARGDCVSLFGWDGNALAGRNIGVLLQGGLDNEIGRFLLRRQSGKGGTETILLRVTVMRKDGSTFPASVTTPTWSLDRRLTKGLGVARQGWTVAFRSLTGQTEAAAPCPELAALMQTAQTAQTSPAQTAQPAQTAPPPPPTFTAREPLPLQAPRLPVVLMTSDPSRAQEPPPTAGTPALAPAHPTPAPVTAHPTPAPVTAHPAPGPVLNAGQAQPEPANEQPRRREFELRAELDAAKEAAGYTEAALKEETSRKQELEQRIQQLTSTLKSEQAERENRFAEEIGRIARERDELKSRLEGSQSSGQELTELRKERDDLGVQLKAEAATAAAARQRAQGLTDRLSANTTELERLRTEFEEQAAERARAEAKWREQLAAEQARRAEIEQRSGKATEGTSQLQEELFALRRERDELKARPATGNSTDTGFKRRAEELQARLDQNTAELERVQSELDAQLAEREQADAQWRAQLESEKSRKREMEASWSAVVERNIKFDEELTSLRRTHDELLAQVSAEQSGADESRHRAVELEARLSENAAELERVTAALAAQQDEHSRADSARDQQLEAEKAQKQEIETAWATAVARNQELEEEMAGIGKERAELQAKLDTELAAVAAARKRAGELEGRLTENATECQRLKTDLKRIQTEREHAEGTWRAELEAERAGKQELETACHDALRRKEESEAQTANLHKEQERLTAELSAERQTAAEAVQRINDLEHRLRDNESDLKRVRTDLEAQHAERGRVEADWSRQLEAAKEEKLELETARSEAVEHNRHLDHEMAGLRQQRDKLLGQLKAEQTACAEARRRAQELESRLGRHAAEFEETRNELAQRQSERDRVESEWGAQLEAAKVLTRKLETAWAGAVERNKRLERELAAFRQERDDLQSRLASSAGPVARPPSTTTQSGIGRNGTPPHRTSVPAKPSTATTRPVLPLPREPRSIQPATPALRPADRRPGLKKEIGTTPPLSMYNLQP
jgi:chromosome segregation ATPase